MFVEVDGFIARRLDTCFLPLRIEAAPSSGSYAYTPRGLRIWGWGRGRGHVAPHSSHPDPHQVWPTSLTRSSSMTCALPQFTF